MPKHFPPGYCPDGCSGGNSNRQMDIGESLLAQFPESVRTEISTRGGGKRCTYCGLVYLTASKSRLGFYENGVTGTRWFG
ncbi:MULTISPECIES: hypothetical protein [unclassified Pseudomonas]|uniref:hypothetical protein n=1 Tax=unclassified Pseudomonas TaxID=196821 RepID=UPI001C60C432|nr:MULTISPECIES: hypothetical protein [unclassified Pseudomonas]MBW5416092.1 hypothetical protein [Pseudomonas sp. MAG002Y]